MVRLSLTYSSAPPVTLTEYSRAPKSATCQSSNRRTSSSWSILKPPRRSASKFHRLAARPRRRGDRMRRREFVTLLGGSAAAWPFRAHAQKPGASVGFIHASAADRSRDVVAAFEDGLSQAGYLPGDTLRIEYRWANDDYDRLPRLAQELVSHQVAVILAATPVAALAAMHATGQIPIVFCVGSDPVKDGLVTNLNRPTGNITGTTFFGDLLSAKRLELLHEIRSRIQGDRRPRKSEKPQR